MKAALPTAKLSIAEDIRLEVNGKATLVGFFPDNVIISDAAGREITPEQPIVLTLAFMITLANFPPEPKQYKSVLELVEPSGQAEKIGEQSIANPGSGFSTNLIFKFMGLAFPESGVRHIRLRLDRATIDLPYEVRIINSAVPSHATVTVESSRRTKQHTATTKPRGMKSASKAIPRKTVSKKPA